jgi:hypothetical protein
MLGLGSWLPSSSQTKTVDYCQVYGSIYFTSKAADADFVVFVESQESFANVVIFKELAPNYANQIGKWHLVEDARLADYNIFISPNMSQSDFTIAFTDTESFAGCNK